MHNFCMTKSPPLENTLCVDVVVLVQRGKVTPQPCSTSLLQRPPSGPLWIWPDTSFLFLIFFSDTSLMGLPTAE